MSLVSNMLAANNPFSRSFWKVSDRWSETQFRKRFFWICYAIVILALVVNQVGKSFAITINVYPETCIDNSRLMVLDLRGFKGVSEFKKMDAVAFKSKSMRRFFPEHTIYAKYVAGVEGDVIRVNDGAVFINDKEWGRLNLVTSKKLKEPMSSFDRTFTVGKDELLMLGTHPDSYDGRYWGVIKKEEILGRVYQIF